MAGGDSRLFALLKACSGGLRGPASHPFATPARGLATAGSLTRANEGRGVRLPSLAEEEARQARRLQRQGLAAGPSGGTPATLQHNAGQQRGGLVGGGSGAGVPLPAASAADGALVEAPPRALPPQSSGDGEPAEAPMAQRVLSDLQRAGRVHRQTLAAMEGSKEWQDYEAHVNFELNVLRMRYAATPDAQPTAARRAQMQAHLRAKQAEVMEEHASAAARKFVESLSPNEVRQLRDMVARLDPPGVGQLARKSEEAEAAERGAQVAADAEKLRDLMWQASRALAGLKGEDAPSGRGGKGPGLV